MHEITELLRQNAPLIWSWRWIVWASAAYLILLGALIFVRPVLVHRFFDGFVGSHALNALEAAVRLIVGLAFIGVSPDTPLPIAFSCFGAVMIATSIPMFFLYQFHKRQAQWAVPFAKRILPVMGLFAIGMGAAIIWAFR